MSVGLEARGDLSALRSPRGTVQGAPFLRERRLLSGRPILGATFLGHPPLL